MATQPDQDALNVQEQIARIAKTLEEIVKTQAETVHLRAQKAKAETETVLMPRSMIFQAMLATAALLGAGAAIAKLFFP